ncbi:hypothetical protein LG200_05055 [Methylobacillus caricis]|uniref:hypothetical protein n=1 Tax=Methylobacillus caricis TaxID=1971611 RepID=UPI001CFFBC02|nr:hypothetical protein [Methylobacillus caricis]MCB5187372.1 hypothetical protein [Methylobacillus caricis]
MTPIQATIKRATLQAQRQMNDLDGEALEALQSLYEMAAEQIRDHLDAAGDSDGTVQLQRLQDVLVQIDGRLRALSVERSRLLNGNLKAAANLGTVPFSAVRLGIMQQTEGILSQAAAVQISDRAVNFVRTFIDGNGLQLSDRIWRLDRHARDVMTNAVEMAVIQGQGAAEAAREFLARGEIVPIEIQTKIGMANSRKIGKDTAQALLTGEGSPMSNAMRVFRTEINRAHGEAYIDSALSHPMAAGVRFKLSPAHPRPDICDFHAAANLYGLGKGVYPTRDKCPWPAHPNTLSYVEVVFKDEITDEDREGKETPLETLDRMTPAQRIGVLGKKKNEVYQDGQLKQGMIKARWKDVQKRIGSTPSIRPPRPISPARIKGRLTLDAILKEGNTIADDVLKSVLGEGGRPDIARLREVIHDALAAARPINTPAKVRSKGVGAQFVQAASQLFPDSWTKKVDQYGPLFVKFSSRRGYQYTIPSDVTGKAYKIMGLSGVSKGGEGFIQLGTFSTAVHEYVHRIQHVIPQLDDYFQELHHRRTNGDQLKKLSQLMPGYGYGSNEVTREDHYIHPYQGRIYNNTSYRGKYGALEVMTMSIEDVLGGNHQRLQDILERDREMFDLVIGVLFKYEP